MGGSGLSDRPLIVLDELRFFEMSRILLRYAVSDAGKHDYPLHAISRKLKIVKAMSNPPGRTLLDQYDSLKALARSAASDLEELEKELESSSQQLADNIVALYDSALCRAVILFLTDDHEAASRVLEELYRGRVSPGAGLDIYHSAKAILALRQQNVVDSLLYHSFNMKAVGKHQTLLHYDTYSTLVSWLVGISRRTRGSIEPTLANVLAHSVFVFELMRPIADVGLAPDLVPVMREEVSTSLGWAIAELVKLSFFGKVVSVSLLLRAEEYSHFVPSLRNVFRQYSLSELIDSARKECDESGLKDLSGIVQVIGLAHRADLAKLPFDSLVQMKNLLEDPVKRIDLKPIVTSCSLDQFTILEKYALDALLDIVRYGVGRFWSERSQTLERAGVGDAALRELVATASRPGQPLRRIIQALAPEQHVDEEGRAEVARELAGLVAANREEGVSRLLALVRERDRTIKGIEQFVKDFDDRFSLPNPRPVELWLAPGIPPELYHLLEWMAPFVAGWAVGKLLDLGWAKVAQEEDFNEKDREKIVETQHEVEEVSRDLEEMKAKVDEVWRRQEERQVK